MKNKIMVPTGSNPFLTKKNRDVFLNKQVCLTDTPGMMIQGIKTEDLKGSDEMRFLRSAIQIDDISSPQTIIPAVLSKIDKNELLVYYRISDYSDHNRFLELVALKKGFVN